MTSPANCSASAKSAPQHRPQRLPLRGQRHAEPGPQLGANALEGGDISVEAGHVGALEAGRGPHPVALRPLDEVAGTHRQRQQLVGQTDALVDVDRTGEADGAHEQRQGQGVGIVGDACEVERFLRELGGGDALALRERPVIGQPGEDAGAQRRVIVAERGEGLLAGGGAAGVGRADHAEVHVERGGLSEAFGRVGVPGRVGRPPGGVLVAVDVAGVEARLGQREQQIGAASGVGRFGELEGLEPPLQMGGGLLEGELIGGAGGGRQRVVGRLGGLPALGKVVGERGQMLVARRQVLERLADAQVEAGAPRRTQLRQQDLADEGVGERVAPGPVTNLDDHPGGSRLVERVEELVGAGLADAFEQQVGEGRPRDRGHRQDAVGGGRQGREATPDDLADALGDADLRQVELEREAVAVVEHAGVDEVVEDLAEEERIAFGLAMQRLGEGELGGPRS